MILFFTRKMKDDLSQKIRGNMIISVYSVKMVFLFPINMTLLFFQKVKMIFSRKNALKDDISSVTEKGDIHPRIYIFSKKLKMIKKFTFIRKFQ